MVAITDYCTSSPTSLVTNSQVAGSYTKRLGDTASLLCAYGYEQSSSAVATCTSYNATAGFWALSNNFNCTSVLFSLTECNYKDEVTIYSYVQCELLYLLLF